MMRSAILCSWLAMGGTLIAQGGPAGPIGTAHSQSVRLKLRAVKPELQLDTKGAFEVRFSNESDRSIWIYRDLSYGTEIWIKDAAGMDLPHASVGPLCPPPPPESGDFIQLPPGKAIVLNDSRSPRELGISRPGKYVAVATYFYQVSFTRGRKVLSLIDDPATSTAICIEVR